MSRLGPLEAAQMGQAVGQPVVVVPVPVVVMTAAGSAMVAVQMGREVGQPVAVVQVPLVSIETAGSAQVAVMMARWAT